MLAPGINRVLMFTHKPIKKGNMTMAKNSNPNNELVKHRYFRVMEIAKGRDASTVDKIAEHILRFEEFTGFADFATYNDKQGEGFRQHLIDAKNARTGKPLSKSTIVATLNSMRRFFEWLSREPGFRSRIKPSHIEFLRPSLKDARIAQAKIEAEWPSIEQAGAAFRAMPVATPSQRRDKAAFALFMLTGIRVTAALSLKLKSVDLVSGLIHQHGRDVKTKFAKSFDSVFFPVDPIYRAYFTAWIEELRKVHLFGPDDPVLPRMPQHFDTLTAAADKPLRAPLRDGNTLRHAIQGAFVSQGMPSFRLHAFRKTLAMLANELCKTPEELKAYSQNFGHESIATTVDDYMPVSTYRQREIIKDLAKRVVTE